MAMPCIPARTAASPSARQVRKLPLTQSHIRMEPRADVNRDNSSKLRNRVVGAAESTLERQGHVSAIDVLIGIGWLEPVVVRRWTQGQLPTLEQGIQTNPSRIAEAMKLFCEWATQKQMHPSETAYVARTPARSALRFSASGDPTVERVYRTHWVSTALSDRKRERIESEANRAPELLVIQPLDQNWKCHKCGGTGAFLIMENPGPSCLPCAGLGGLEFLPSGDAALTRRAKAKSERHAVVVRFSRSRKRYERQGLLVEPAALSAT